MIEKEIESRLRKRLKKSIKNALCLKFVSPGFTGVPDRIVFLPGGNLVFVELKKPKEKERKRQLYVQWLLRALGFEVFSSIDSYDKVEMVVNRCIEITARSGFIDSATRVCNLGGATVESADDL